MEESVNTPYRHALDTAVEKLLTTALFAEPEDEKEQPQPMPKEVAHARQAIRLAKATLKLADLLGISKISSQETAEKWDTVMQDRLNFCNSLEAVCPLVVDFYQKWNGP